MQLTELKVPEPELVNETVPVGITAVPELVSVTVAVQVTALLRAVEEGEHKTVEDVERRVKASEKLIVELPE